MIILGWNQQAGVDGWNIYLSDGLWDRGQRLNKKPLKKRRYIIKYPDAPLRHGSVHYMRRASVAGGMEIEETKPVKLIAYYGGTNPKDYTKTPTPTPEPEPTKVKIKEIAPPKLESKPIKTHCKHAKIKSISTKTYTPKAKKVKVKPIKRYTPKPKPTKTYTPKPKPILKPKPTKKPTPKPTKKPTLKPTKKPTPKPKPTKEPTLKPTKKPTPKPKPTKKPTLKPTKKPTRKPKPTKKPTIAPPDLDAPAMKQQRGKLIIAWRTQSGVDGWNIYFSKDKKKGYRRANRRIVREPEYVLRHSSLQAGKHYYIHLVTVRGGVESKRGKPFKILAVPDVRR